LSGTNYVRKNMNIIIKEYTSTDHDKWDDFVNKSNNGTLFHTIQFLSYHNKSRFNTRHLIIEKNKDDIIAVIPLAISTNNNQTTGKSPYGASFGGCVTKNLSFRETVEINNLFIKYLKAYNIKKLVIIPPPLFYSKKPNCYQEFALLKAGANLINRDITSVINLPACSDDPIIHFKSTARTAIRKAIKNGIVVEESQNYHSFYEILMENQNAHNSKPTHSYKELLQLKSLCPNALKLNMAFYKNRPIAAILYFICNPKVALTFYICHLKSFEHLRPINLLLYEGIKWAQKQNFSHVDLGTSTVNMEPRENLIAFKEKFGATGYFRDTYSLKIL